MEATTDSMPTPARKRVYGARSLKRIRRTNEEIQNTEAVIYLLLKGDHPQTIRQIFYALTVRKMVPKTEQGYKAVMRSLCQMRRRGEIPYHWIADNTRWMRKPSTHSSLKGFLDDTARFYRRDLWADAPVYVEVWCEKDALAGVILEETAVYDVPLMVSRGFSSDTYLYDAAAAIRLSGKPTFIYQLGDRDPSGLWISSQIEKGLRRHAPDAEIHFERVAVTEEQIATWHLPSRPTKRNGNSHAKDFVGDSVELDAIPATELRRLVRECIERHVDHDRLRILKVAEESERQYLRSLAAAAGA